MKVLYVAPDVPVPHTGKFLGGTTHVLKVSESLAKRGHEVWIISRRMRGQSKFEKITGKIVTRRFYRGLILPLEGKPKCNGKNESLIGKIMKVLENLYFAIYRLVLASYVLWLLSKYNFDLVVERNSARGIGVFPAKVFRIRSVVEVIDPDFSKLQLKLADRVLAYTRDIVPEDCRTKVVLTHAGVDVELFNSVDLSEVNGIKSKFGLQNKRVVVYIGEISEWHGADLLIDIAEKIDDVVFLMIGKNIELLREDVDERRLSEKFVFTGFVRHEDIPKFVSIADVAVAPYRKTRDMEKFYFSPIKIFEYMACGKPIIASDLEIIRDIINENKCGILAKPNDVEDFARKITYLIDNINLREKLGKNGMKRVVKKYTWMVVADKIIGGF